MDPASRKPDVEVEAFHVADFVHPSESPLAGRPGLVMAYAVRHPGGVLLFDTGIGLGNDEITAEFQARIERLPALLEGRGIHPDDVVAIANSHLHFDHCGQNLAFRDRPIYAQADEYEATRAADYTIPGWVDFPGVRYELIHGERELLPGVRLVPTPGHTPGHQSMLIDGSRGRIAIVGQAFYSRAEWDGSDAPDVSGLPSAWNQDHYRRSREFLRAFEPDRVLFGHDR
ncbi:MAG: N-acyl homoserine lactonase family protein [Candidatus Limnocylindrales bacterium]